MNDFDLTEKTTEEKIDVISFLDDKQKLKKIFEYSENYYEESYIYGKLLETKDEIEKYVINKITDKNIDEKDYIRVYNYILVLVEYIIKNPNIIYSNPIFRLDDNIVLDFIGETVYNYILNLSIETSKKAKLIYKKFINNQNSLTLEEYKFLIDFFTNNIDSEILNINVAKKNLVTKILNSMKGYNDLRTKNYILRYLVYEKSKTIGGDVKLYFCDDYFGEIDDYFGRVGSNRIIINSSCFRNTKINKLKILELKNGENLTKEEQNKTGFPAYQMIYTLYHELGHVKQYYDLKKGCLNSEAISRIERLLFGKYLNKDEYRKNYDFYDIEIQANIVACDETVKFYERFAPKALSNVDDKLLEGKISEEKKRSYSYKKDENNLKFTNEYFIVSNLNKILFENIKELNNYPQLKEFYNENGTLKSIEELLVRKKSFKDNNLDDSIFNKFIMYYVEIGMLENLNLLNYNDNIRINLLYILEEIFFSEIRSLYDIKNSYDKNDKLKNNIKLIIDKKMLKLDNMLKFFKSYYETDRNIYHMIKNDIEYLKNIIPILEQKTGYKILPDQKGDELNGIKVK